jgi:hypothetical protein
MMKKKTVSAVAALLWAMTALVSLPAQTGPGTGSVRVQSVIAGTIWIEGWDAGVNIEAGGSATLQNVSVGETALSLKTADGWVFTKKIQVDPGKTWAAAFSDRPQDFNIMINDSGGITIIKYKGNGTYVVIPESVDGINVTEIAVSAFESMSNLISVTIPDGVTAIGARAFMFCDRLNQATRETIIKRFGSGIFE